MLDYFKNKYPFTSKYFDELLSFAKEGKRNFPQAIIFEGADTKIQYLFSLELARILNCENFRDENCGCINCKWIKTYTHPAVNIVSQIHFKGENDETKTVISTAQAHQIEKSLALSSDYHRFFIFFSSKKTEDYNDLKDFRKLGYLDSIDYTIEPLDFTTFHPSTPNALLKSIEEPPKNTTFIFLTKSKEDILSTIVSRCNVFKLGASDNKKQYPLLNELIPNYPNISYSEALEISQNLEQLSKEDSPEKILNNMMGALLQLLKENRNSLLLNEKINKDIKFISHAIKSKRANMSDKIIFETLMLKIARGY